MLNSKLRSLKRAMIEARGDVVRAVDGGRSPEKIQQLRCRADTVFQRLYTEMKDSGFSATAIGAR
ncbi:MAG TPA: hypothetical protein VL966_03480 [Alphaproteobacteria bacterium]|jgi:hypothetical protein|nr:hypothetical protein [Alphaproteobacteria bacterium]